MLHVFLCLYVFDSCFANCEFRKGKEEIRKMRSPRSVIEVNKTQFLQICEETERHSRMCTQHHSCDLRACSLNSDRREVKMHVNVEQILPHRNDGLLFDLAKFWTPEVGLKT